MNKMSKIYLDYAASTPVDPAVFRAMKPYFTERFGNPGSLHGFGQEAIAAVDASRETIAKAIGADFREVIFTASATEANNLALRGAVRGFTQMRRGLTRMKIGEDLRAIRDYPRPRLIVSAIEHESVLETAHDLEKEGIDVVYIPVNRNGAVDLKKLKESLTENTVLVSVMYANNEIGIVQPIREISKIITEFKQLRIANYEFKKESVIRDAQSCNYPFFHTDAAQAFQFLDCNVQNLGVDFMTLSAHKIYGPKGAGALYVSGKGLVTSNKGGNKHLSPVTCHLSPLLLGGGQEFGMRPGTENVPAIVGLAKAVEAISFSSSQEHWNGKIGDLRDYLWKGIKKICPKAELNSLSLVTSHLSLPNILNVYFPNHDAQDLLTRFDLNGLAVSSGSACRSRAMESSYVVQALGYSKERAKSSIRFSLGRPTTRGGIDGALKIIKKVLR